MGEKQKFIVKNISYEGLFDYRHLFRIMDFWFRDKFYDKFEKLNEEFVGPKGKYMVFEFIPWKKVTDYHKIMLKVEGKVTELKEVMVKIGNKQVKMQHGKISLKLTGYLVVDYYGRNNTPLLYFIRDLYDKYVYHYITKKYYGMTIDHVTELTNVIQAYLNMTPKKL